MNPGLSETSASSKFGGEGRRSSVEPLHVPRCRHGGLLAALLVARRDVRRVGRVLHVEGPLARGFGELVDGELVQDRRQVVLLLVAVALRLAVQPQRVVVIGVLLERRVELVPARRDRLRALGLAVAVHVLADVDRPVARCLQPGRQRRRRVDEQAVVVFEHAVVVGVLTGEEGGPRRAAGRGGDDRVREVGALAIDLLDRLRHRLLAHHADALVVGHHHHDVRACVGLARVGIGACGRATGEQGQAEEADGGGDHSQNGRPSWWRSRPSMPAQLRSFESRSASPS